MNKILGIGNYHKNTEWFLIPTFKVPGRGEDSVKHPAASQVSDWSTRYTQLGFKERTGWCSLAETDESGMRRVWYLSARAQLCDISQEMFVWGRDASWTRPLFSISDGLLPSPEVWASSPLSPEVCRRIFDLLGVNYHKVKLSSNRDWTNDGELQPTWVALRISTLASGCLMDYLDRKKHAF